MSMPPRRDEAAYDEPCAPRRRLQKGYDTRAPPPPDPRIRRRAMRAATTPSRRKRASPPPVHPRIDQVFTPANTHHHRTPHPSDHVAHTTMATGQHLTTGSAHEHRGTTTRGRHPGIPDLDTTSLETHRNPNQRYGRKGPPFAPLSCPQRRNPIGRPKLASIDPSGAPGTKRARSCCRARDEHSPAAGHETSIVLLPGARQGRSCCRARDEVGTAAGRETSDGPLSGEGRTFDEGSN